MKEHKIFTKTLKNSRTILSDLFQIMFLFKNSFHVHTIIYVISLCILLFIDLLQKYSVISVTKRDPISLVLVALSFVLTYFLWCADKDGLHCSRVRLVWTFKEECRLLGSLLGLWSSLLPPWNSFQMWRNCLSEMCTAPQGVTPSIILPAGILS
jgi:hypothetical protein